MNNLGYWCQSSVDAYPDRAAIVDLSRDPPREVTYRELDERMNRVASLLTARGIEPGDRIAMAIGNRFEFVEIMYGAMRAGVVPVPLNTKLGADALDYILQDAGVVAAFVEPEANRFIVDVVDALALEHRVAFTSPHDGWSAYEPLLDGERSCVRPAPQSRTTTRRFSPTRPAPRANPREWC